MYNHLEADSEHDSYFVSMTDIMVGLLFIFLMLVAYFVIQVQLDHKKPDPIKEYAENAIDQRDLILVGIKQYFEEQGFFEVVIDQASGVLRFPDGVLFGSGQYRFYPGTKMSDTVNTLADALAAVLPCSVLDSQGRRYLPESECAEGSTPYPNPNDAFIEAIYIEGHTDSVPIRSRGLPGDTNLNTNLKLSTRRAANTYEEIMRQRPVNGRFFGPVSATKSKRFQAVIAVSGYGSQRPIKTNETPQGRTANRRIDLRILMYQPRTIDELDSLMESLGNAVEKMAAGGNP